MIQAGSLTSCLTGRFVIVLSDCTKVIQIIGPLFRSKIILIVLHSPYLGIIHLDREADTEGLLYCPCLVGEHQGEKHDITLSFLAGCHAMPRCPGPRCACHSSLFLLDSNPSDFLPLPLLLHTTFTCTCTCTLITSPTYRRSSTNSPQPKWITSRNSALLSRETITESLSSLS